MPFFVPVVLGLGAAGLALFGLDRGNQGRADLKEAKAILEDARLSHEDATARLEAARARVNARATAFAEQKEALIRGPLAEVTAFLSAIQANGAFKDGQTLAGVRLTLPEGPAGGLNPVEVQDALAGLGAVVLTGALSSQSAGLGAALFGVASTGAAIGGLSGAAATSATLAWLGGGALAAGGGGMALGRIVLGGVAIGPAMAVVGLLVAKQGSVSLTRAQEVRAAARESVARMETVIDLLGAAQVRIDELSGSLDGLAARLAAVLDTLDPSRWSPDSDEDVAALQTLLTLAMALANVIRAPVLDAEGGIAPESFQVQIDYRDLVA